MRASVFRSISCKTQLIRCPKSLDCAKQLVQLQEATIEHERISFRVKELNALAEKREKNKRLDKVITLIQRNAAVWSFQIVAFWTWCIVNYVYFY